MDGAPPPMLAGQLPSHSGRPKLRSQGPFPPNAPPPAYAFGMGRAWRAAALLMAVATMGTGHQCYATSRDDDLECYSEASGCCDDGARHQRDATSGYDDDRFRDQGEAADWDDGGFGHQCYATSRADALLEYHSEAPGCCDDEARHQCDATGIVLQHSEV